MSSQRSLARKSIAVVGLLVATGLGLPDAAPAVSGPRPVLEHIGELDRFPADARALLGSELVPSYEKTGGNSGLPGERYQAGTIITLPKARLLVQIYSVNNRGKSGLVVRDLDSMRILRTAVLGGIELARGGRQPDGNGGWMYAVDDDGSRLFLVRRDHSYVEEFDVGTLAHQSRPLLGSTSPRPDQYPFRVGGITYDPFANDLLLLYGGPTATYVAHVNTLVYRMDLDGAPPSAFPPAELAKFQRLRSCSGPVMPAEGAPTVDVQWQILVTRDHFFVPCHTTAFTVLVVRIARGYGGEATPTEEVAAGPLYAHWVLADPGGGRLFVTTEKREIWAFEAATMAFIGLVPTRPENTGGTAGYGLDPATGRVFFQSATFGLGVVEGRFFPLPQARTLPRFVVGREQIWSDPVTGRVFVLEGESEERPAAYRVYRTDPAPKPPPPPDPDANTADVDEKPGATEARFNASASGYGARALFARGLATVPPAPAYGVNTPTADLLFKTVNPPCGFTDRDVFAGRVARSEYDTGSTAAQAVTVAFDGNTPQDVDQPGRCASQLGTSADDDRWTYTPAMCSSSAGGIEHEPAGEGAFDPGPVSVSCPEPGGVLEARAAAEGRLDEEVSVTRSWTTTRVEPVDGGGVRSTVTAVAEGITINGVLRIGEVRSTATSFSNGRPKRRAMSEHAISVSHVALGDIVLCEGACDLEALEQRLNTAAVGRAMFRTGAGADAPRDDVLLEGSPRGAQTGVQKSAARQSSDRTLVGDFTVEVPALEVTVLNDNNSWGRARQVYQFAGVATAATYNIVKLPTFSDLPLLDEPASDAMEVDDLVGLAFAEDGSGAGSHGTSHAASSASNRRAGPRGWAAPFVAVARGLRLALTDPRSGVLLLGVWALLGLPAVLARRRVTVSWQ